MHCQWTSDSPVALILLSAQLLVLAPHLPDKSTTSTANAPPPPPPPPLPSRSSITRLPASVTTARSVVAANERPQAASSRATSTPR